jgi:hypothetical protein
VDGDGNWVVDFGHADPAGTTPEETNTLDIWVTTVGEALWGDADGDHTDVQWRGAEVSAHVTENVVYGQGWPDGATVNLDINGTDLGSGTSTHVTWYDGTAVQFNLGTSWTLTAGDVIKLADEWTEKALTVHDLVVTDVDLVDDTVTGTVNSTDNVEVRAYCSDTGCEGYRRELPTAGAWQADFQVPGDESPEEDGTPDLVPGASGSVTTHDSDGDFTYVNWYTRFLHPKSDFDGDYTSDMATFHAATGLWGILRSEDAFSYSSPQYITWGQTGDIVAPGDYDGDGLLDPTVRRPPAGGQSAAYMILSSLAGYDYGSTLTVPAGWPGLGDTPVPGDYNNDSFTDPAIWRGNTGVWIIPLSPSFSSYQFFAWGQSGDTPVGADVDGDGQTDIGYWRPTTGVWGFLQSSKGYSYSDALFFNWGYSGDKAVMADYDGDGYADPAVVIPPASGMSQAYRILLSSLDYDPGLSITIPAGWPGLHDTPVPTDYDGDGLADAGIWRENTGVWIIPKSSTNNAQYMFAAWGASGDQVVK